MRLCEWWRRVRSGLLGLQYVGVQGVSLIARFCMMAVSRHACRVGRGALCVTASDMAWAFSSVPRRLHACSQMVGNCIGRE